MAKPSISVHFVCFYQFLSVSVTISVPSCIKCYCICPKYYWICPKYDWISHKYDWNGHKYDWNWFFSLNHMGPAQPGLLVWFFFIPCDMKPYLLVSVKNWLTFGLLKKIKFHNKYISISRDENQLTIYFVVVKKQKQKHCIIGEGQKTVKFFWLWNKNKNNSPCIALTYGSSNMYWNQSVCFQTSFVSPLIVCDGSGAEMGLRLSGDQSLALV